MENLTFKQFVNSLNEDVFGKRATLFHRVDDNYVAQICDVGFHTGGGGGASHGKGMYAFFDLETAMLPQNIHYGNYIVKGSVDLSRHLIFLPEVAQKVHGVSTLSEQAKLLRIPLDLTNWDEELKSVSSSQVAMNVSHIIFKMNGNLISGMIYETMPDKYSNRGGEGKTIVTYDKSKVEPIAFAEAPQPNSSIEWKRCGKLAQQQPQSQPQQPQPQPQPQRNVSLDDDFFRRDQPQQDQPQKRGWFWNRNNG